MEPNRAGRQPRELSTKAKDKMPGVNAALGVIMA
jgi:hypothetical protein